MIKRELAINESSNPLEIAEYYYNSWYSPSMPNYIILDVSGSNAARHSALKQVIDAIQECNKKDNITVILWDTDIKQQVPLSKLSTIPLGGGTAFGNLSSWFTTRFSDYSEFGKRALIGTFVIITDLAVETAPEEFEYLQAFMQGAGRTMNRGLIYVKNTETNFYANIGLLDAKPFQKDFDAITYNCFDTEE